MHYLSLLSMMMLLFSLPLFGSESARSAPFFQASPKQPYHLSVGAVLFNEEGKIACHHFTDEGRGLQLYILMRESMEDGESPLTTLQRGLMEEFGATGEPVAFLGCLSGPAPMPTFTFEKSTLYIACKVVEWKPENRDPNDPEACSVLEWLTPEALIPLMEQQGKRFPDHGDIDESVIVKRAIPYIRASTKRSGEIQ